MGRGALRSLLLAVSAFAGGCVHSTPLALEGADLDAQSSGGMPGYQRSAGGLRVALFYAGVQDGLLVFDVDLTNTSSRALEVAPASFSCLIDRGHVQAVDPEERLEQLQRERGNAREGFLPERGGSGAVGDLAGTLAEADVESGRQRDGERSDRYADRDRREDELRTRRAWFDAEERRWTHDFLHRTRLSPQAAIRRLVAFPAERSAHRVMVVLEAGAEPLRFSFRVLPR